MGRQAKDAATESGHGSWAGVCQNPFSASKMHMYTWEAVPSQKLVLTPSAGGSGHVTSPLQRKPLGSRCGLQAGPARAAAPPLGCRAARTADLPVAGLGLDRRKEDGSPWARPAPRAR